MHITTIDINGNFKLLRTPQLHQLHQISLNPLFFSYNRSLNQIYLSQYFLETSLRGADLSNLEIHSVGYCGCAISIIWSLIDRPFCIVFTEA